MSELEHIDCPLCHSNGNEKMFVSKDYLYSFKKFTVVRCQQCGLVYTNPRVREDKIGAYYYSEYLPPYEEIKESRRLLQNLKVKFKHLLGDTALQILQTLKSIGSQTVLEIGPGAGSLLNILKNNGFKVAGVDRDINCVKHIREMDITCYLGDLNEVIPEIGTKKFDAVVFHHAFEHLYNPKETLNNVYKLLNEKGIIYLSIPNVGSFEAKLFGKYWKGLDLPRHIIHYDTNSINKIIIETNFKIISLDNDNFPSSFIESLGFLLFRRRIASKFYYLLYYPWKLLAPLHMKLIGSGVMSVIAKKY